MHFKSVGVAGVRGAMIFLMGRLAILAWAFLGLLLLGPDAGPGRRVALVIGNGTYAEAGTLANPVNDALDIADNLRTIGFEVIEGNDLGKREVERSIGEFSDALEGAGVGLFYYAGHGLQVEGRNYIVPVDARLDVPVSCSSKRCRSTKSSTSWNSRPRSAWCSSTPAATTRLPAA
ncbi:caspase family protein [Mesorhizobium sp. LNHC229A00]|uniref:caspase family protein n=1 Tax=Mesorhizobium sp. LNHC229A00 TaxID=1287240 RepID=UPI0004148654|nr:caspase family protein [Mesorhizobium sp. LNHC229A00]